MLDFLQSMLVDILRSRPHRNRVALPERAMILSSFSAIHDAHHRNRTSLHEDPRERAVVVRKTDHCFLGNESVIERIILRGLHRAIFFLSISYLFFGSFWISMITIDTIRCIFPKTSCPKIHTHRTFRFFYSREKLFLFPSAGASISVIVPLHPQPEDSSFPSILLREVWQQDGHSVRLPIARLILGTFIGHGSHFQSSTETTLAGDMAAVINCRVSLISTR